MLGKLFNRLFVRSSSRPNLDDETLIQRVASGVTLDTLPPEYRLCIFQGSDLVNCCHDTELPCRQDGEHWYLIPASDVSLAAQISVGEQVVEVEVTIRIEPQSELLSLLNQCDVLTREDMTALICSQMAGLVDERGFQAAKDLVELSEEAREEMRARLSLLLQLCSVRCTAIERFVIKELSEPEGSDESKPVVEINEAPLTDAVVAVSTDEQWQEVVATLDAEGCELDAESAERAQQLGEQVVAQRISAGEAVAQLRKLADLARANLMPRVDRMLMRGMDIRLGFAFSDDAHDEDDPGAMAQAEIRVRRRPRTWWMLSRKKADERLQRYLRETLSSIRSTLDSARTGGGFQPHFADLRRIDQRLGICLDQLATVPTFMPKHRNLRLERADIKAALSGVQRAVRAAETVAAESKQLQFCQPRDDQWNRSCQRINAELDRLSQELNQRRQLHI